MLRVGDTCKLCLQKVPQWVIDEKRRRKIENARLSSKKAQANGNHKHGRKRIRNDEQIRNLRKSGMSVKEIAKEIGLSITAVRRGLRVKETK